MDVQRMILIAAFAIISYMMVFQWNLDNGQVPEAEVATATTSVSAYADPSQTDLPTVNASSADATLPPTAASGSTTGLITVSTDVLNVIIDSTGGDIIEVSLPEHKKTQGADLPFVLLEQNANRTYVSQSGLIGANGPDANTAGRPQYTTQASAYSLGNEEKIDVDFNYVDQNGVGITKRYTFTKGSYNVALTYIINNTSNASWTANLFAQIKRDASEDPTQTTDMGMKSYLGAVFSTNENNYEKVDFDDMDEANFKSQSTNGYVGFVQHYFVSAWIPNQSENVQYQSRTVNGNYIMGFTAPSFTLAPGQSTTLEANFYAGPKDPEQMEAAHENLKLTVDYGILWWIASPLYSILTWIQGIVGNWGLAIIGITLLVKAVLYPLNEKAFRSMAKMRKFGPEMARMKEMYGDDRQRMSQEMMKLYQKEKINPVGGCLPMIAQMPIFIALYWVLMESVELRHASFLYISDLSDMDPYFILPILMGASMFIQQSLNPTPPDPMQAKIMKMLPIMFTFFFLWFPAGLTLYWVVNNILSIAQQYVINKKIEGSSDAPAPAK
ncbi:MAG: membrane protein insertase YidC [Pontibacterium sp.]